MGKRVTALLGLVLLLASPLRPVGADTFLINELKDNPLFSDVVGPMLREAYGFIGVTVEFRDISTDNSLAAIEQGALDGDSMHVRSIVETSPAVVVVSEPLLTVTARAFTLGREIRLSGWESLRPYRLCLRNLDTIAVAKTEGMQREFAPDFVSLFKMLVAKKCDIAIAANIAVPAILPEDRPKIRELADDLGKFEVVTSLARRHADLAPALAHSIRNLKQSGAMKRRLEEFSRRVRLVGSEWPRQVVLAIPESTAYSVSDQGRLESFLLDVVRRSFDRAQIGVTLKFYPWARCLEETRLGNVDGTFAAYRTSEREAYFDFSTVPVLRTVQNFYVAPSASAAPHQLSDYFERRVGVVRGTSHGPAIDEAVRAGRFHHLEETTGYDNLVSMLDHGRLDAILASNDSTVAALARRGDPRLVRLDPSLAEVDAFMVFTKARDLGDFKARFDAAFKGLVDDKEYEALQKQYLQ